MLDRITASDVQDEMLVDDNRLEKKNRYIDILAFEHSRVRLLPRQSLVGKDEFVSSYINANFVDGPTAAPGNRKIIACQGPLDNTIQDVWRMIAQENVTLIVTTCNVVEKGRAKCAHFWPLSADQRAHPNNEAYAAHSEQVLASVGI